MHPLFGVHGFAVAQAIGVIGVGGRVIVRCDISQQANFVVGVAFLQLADKFIPCRDK